MKGRRQIWILALCLTSALFITVSLRARSTGFVTHPDAAPKSQQASTEPAVYVANGSIRATAVPNAALLDVDTDIDRVLAAPKVPSSLLLPSVEEFTLTPPNERLDGKSILSVRFPELPAEQLPAQMPMTLGDQKVVLQRSSQDGRVFSAQVSFDWQSFATEQQRRKEAASHGKMVPIFKDRHFMGVEKMQFVDPADIEAALRSHEPLQFSPHILNGSVASVIPDHELMVVNKAVVEDVSGGRTFDQCLPDGAQGNQNGAWTFATLMMAILNTDLHTAEQKFYNDVLLRWASDQPVNGFSVLARPGIGSFTSNPKTGLLSNWKPDPNDPSLPSLLLAPVHLNAIVNRIDLGANFVPPTTGELRFVFGVTASTSTSQDGVPHSCSAENSLFNIILEYHVPSEIALSDWADRWDSLKQLLFTDTQFMSQLQTKITDPVVQAHSCDGISCLSQIRTNEVALEGANQQFWELRQFQLSINAPLPNDIMQGTVAMTPYAGFNYGHPACNVPSDGGVPCQGSGGTVASYINNVGNQGQILHYHGALPIVPANWPTNGPPFLGGSAYNGVLSSGLANAFWLDNAPILSEQARAYFSQNTCNGCHGGETATGFVHVVNRVHGTTSNLSNFLLGCVGNVDTCTPGTASQCPLNAPCTESVPNPNPHPQQAIPNAVFGDIANRAAYLGPLVDTTPRSGGMLLPFVNPHIGVH